MSGEGEGTLPQWGGDSTPAIDQRFLTPVRIAEIGELIAPLIEADLSWIERRKEVVQILDDSALRRQISVDFSLRRGVSPIKEFKDREEALYCAPVFVLPKSPSALGAFDLCDEDGHALPLLSREDNAAISAATLRSLVASRCGREVEELSPDLAEELWRIARRSPERAEPMVERLLGADGPWAEELGPARKDERLCGWMRTIAHSSIVAILYRSDGPRRKLIKLTFQEEINKQQRRLTRLGWAPYEVMIDSPRIEGRSFHFEAEAPSGLRISKAQLTDSESPDPIVESGSMKRVHLYRRTAQRAGAGTALLSLDVAGPGFVTGAILAAVFTVGALVACALRASSITSNPTSAPALLLVLPGLIASYVARPDRHALTTRLLSFARRLLLAIAFCAYIAAARVALAGAKPTTAAAVSANGGDLELWLWILTVLAALMSTLLAVSWFRGSGVERLFDTDYRFATSRGVPVDPKILEASLSAGLNDCPRPHGYTNASGVEDHVLTMNRSPWHGEWTLTLRVEPMVDVSLLSATLEYVNLVPALMVRPKVRRVEAEKVVAYLRSLTTWAERLDRESAAED